jgi:hypothetical protein
MATFEFDPGPLLPEGFGIIDGGVHRLPRTFVTPTPTLDAHESYDVAIVEPAPERISMWCLLRFMSSSSTCRYKLSIVCLGFMGQVFFSSEILQSDSVS